MSDLLVDLRLEKREPVKVQIRNHLRQLIISGQLAPTTKIPPAQVLAKAWQTSTATIHGALAPLETEGLLARSPRIGTFVRQRAAKLTCVGVYSATVEAESQFGQALAFALKDELHRLGIEPDIWVDPRPVRQVAEPWMPLVRAAQHREFQALIMDNAGLEQLRWLRKLPVPTTALGGLTDMPSRVNIDNPQIADVALQGLTALGCRSAGLIMPVNPSFETNDGTRNEWLVLCERFLELAGQAGVTVRNEWIRLRRDGGDPWSARAYEQFGYEEFLKLWSRPPRPAGLVVFDDTAARGVLLGLREKQVRVPAELKLVLHKNEAVDLFCPMPAVFMVLSEREIARALVSQVQKQFRHEPCVPIRVPLRLLAHPAAVPPNLCDPVRNAQPAVKIVGQAPRLPLRKRRQPERPFDHAAGLTAGRVDKERTT